MCTLAREFPHPGFNTLTKGASTVANIATMFVPFVCMGKVFFHSSLARVWLAGGMSEDRRKTAGCESGSR